MIFSAFNALTLSPALCALILKPRHHTRGPLGWFFDGFNRVFGRSREWIHRFSRILIHKSAFSLLFLALVAVLGVPWEGNYPLLSCPKKTRAT